MTFFIQLKAATHSFMLENDFFAGTDKHYTSGLFYTVMEKDKAITLSQLMFTPSDIRKSEKILNDYPYAGHISLTWHLFQSNNNFFHNMGASIGSVGPVAMGKQVQRAIHKARGVKIPQGWDHQLSNEPTAGVLYQAGAKTKKLQIFSLDFDWTTTFRFDYGNFYSGASLGTVIRFGNHFPKNFPTTGAFFGGQESAMLNMKKVSGFRYSISLGWYVNKVDTFYVIDKAKEHKVRSIDYTVGDFASLNLYYKKFEFEIQFKKVFVNTTRVSPETVYQNHGALTFRWKWN